MRESAQRTLEKEEKVRGLIIVEAKYGCLVTTRSSLRYVFLGLQL